MLLQVDKAVLGRERRAVEIALECVATERFERTPWSSGELGQPSLEGATASFQCQVATSVLWETHHIIIGRVMNVRLSENPASLLYGHRAYHRAVQLP